MKFPKAKVSVCIRSNSMTLYVECDTTAFVEANNENALRDMLESYTHKPSMVEVLETFDVVKDETAE